MEAGTWRVLEGGHLPLHYLLRLVLGRALRGPSFNLLFLYLIPYNYMGAWRHDPLCGYRHRYACPHVLNIAYAGRVQALLV